MSFQEITPDTTPTRWVLVKEKNTANYVEATMQAIAAGEAPPPLPPGYDAATYEVVLADSLAGFAPKAQAPTAQQVIQRMRAIFQAQPLALQYDFKQAMAEVESAALSENLPLMRFIVAQYPFAHSQLLDAAQAEAFRAAFLACFE